MLQPIVARRDHVPGDLSQDAGVVDCQGYADPIASTASRVGTE